MSPIPAVQSFSEDSRQSNRSFSCDGYAANSPQTPLFVSNYEEVNTDCFNVTPNSSFMVLEKIKEDLVLSDASRSNHDAVVHVPLKKREKESKTGMLF